MNWQKVYDDNSKAARELRAKAKNEDGTDRAFTEDEQKAFDEHIKLATEAKKQLDLIKKSADDLALLGPAEEPKADDSPVPAIVGNVAVKERKTPGEIFTESAQYKAAMKEHPHGISTKSPVKVAPVSVGGLKALLTDPGLAAPLHVVAPVGIQVVDLMNAVDVIDNAPEVIKIFRGVFTNAAAVVAEGAAKPESALVWTPETLNLATVAHHIPVTTQALKHNAILRPIIDRLLINGVRAKVAAEVAAMLAAFAGLQVQAFSVDLRTTIRKAVTKAIAGGDAVGAIPNGILLSAADAETIDLESIANIILQPGESFAQMSTLWRLPLVVSAQIPAGFAYVGDLKQIQVYVGAGGVQVSTGWVNTQFTENELTILAETEEISTVLVGPAIVKADLTA